MEKDEVYVDLKTIVKLSVALDMPLNELLDL